jgi:hypothetical protein
MNEEDETSITEKDMAGCMAAVAVCLTMLLVGPVWIFLMIRAVRMAWYG